jgi:hypothetical protein
MKRLTGLTIILLVISVNILNAQSNPPAGLIIKSSDYNEFRMDRINPVAKLVDRGSSFGPKTIRLRAGDSYNYNFGSNQILFSYYKTKLFTHAIKSRHNPENQNDNAIDFYVWDYGTDDSSTVGSKLVMSLNGDNVGIGTGTPKTKLHIYDNSSDVGIKLQNNLDAFDIKLIDLGGRSRQRFILENDLKMEFCDDCEGPRVSSLIIIEDLEIPYNINRLNISYSKGINYLKNGTYRFNIQETGDATFDGKITASEIEVKANVWSDNVFSDNYRIKSLSEVENFIAEFNHLPDVPSESEILENGINLGEMDAILLKKIEELMLYIIEQENRIVELENRLK